MQLWWQARGLEQDPCAVLGVELPPKGGDLPAWKKGPLRARWRAVAKELHPDKGGDPASFARASSAYEALNSIVPAEAWPAEPEEWDGDDGHDWEAHRQAAEALHEFQRLWREQQRVHRERAARKQAKRAAERAAQQQADDDDEYDGPVRSVQPEPDKPRPARQPWLGGAAKPKSKGQGRAPVPPQPRGIVVTAVAVVEEVVALDVAVRKMLAPWVAPPSKDQKAALARIKKLRKSLGG